MTKTIKTLTLALLASAIAAPGFAQFADTEVSLRGNPPFLYSSTGAIFEDLGGSEVYNIYRREPGQDFRCLAPDLPTATWAGDPALPPPGVAWWYQVNAYDGTEENRHGSTLPIGIACHTPPVGGIGACCDGVGGCTEVARADCHGARGTYMGDASTCSDVPAPCACGANGPPTGTWTRVTFATGRIVDIASPLGGPANRMYAVDANGFIRLIENGAQMATPFLNIQARVSCCNERGLLGLAFHPDYMSNGLFYVNYTRTGDGDTVIAEYQVTADPNVADPASERILLTINQPNSNHNGGGVRFGLDGYLYIGMGDGGGGCDRANPPGDQDHGQNIDTLLGSMLRIDPAMDGVNPYTIPPDNPFVGVAGADELYAYGLRNPWRYDIDRVTGDLWIGDVGQGPGAAREEVDYLAAWDNSGQNFGWVCMEGTLHDSCGRGAAVCGAAPDPSWVLPVTEWRGPAQPGGCSAVGGPVYRGTAIPGNWGHYFYADYCGNWLRSFRYACGAIQDPWVWSDQGDWPGITSITAFGQGPDGEIYVVAIGGGIYRLDP